MHSLIIANSYGIRNFGIIYDDKVREMYQKINAEKRCAYPNEMLDYGTVFQQCQESVSIKKIEDAGSKSCEDLTLSIRNALI